MSIDFATRSFRKQCCSYHLLESPSSVLSSWRLTLGEQQKVDLSVY